ncbi:MAG: ribonuclease H-like domain-containing protein [Burkholderiales bacterium]
MLDVNLKERLAVLSRQGGATAAGAVAPSSVVPASVTVERLQHLIDRSAQRAARRCDEGAVAAMLGGARIADGVVLVERFFCSDYVHGDVPLAALYEAPLDVLSDTGPVRPSDLLFLDTETTGLAGGTGTLPFVLGLARFEPEGLRVRQYFLTGFAGEAAMLDHAQSWFDAAARLVTFNGKCFDVPLLATRFRLMQRRTSLPVMPHIDLLHPTRAAFGGIWPDCRLQTAEQRLLGFVRRDDLGGHLVPMVWADFIRCGRMDGVPRVLEHNRWDLVALSALLARLAGVLGGSYDAGADALGVARHRLRRGDEAGALRGLAEHVDSLSVIGLLELAQMHRRRGEWLCALPIWEQLAEQGVAPALERLAKYEEHIRRDFGAALTLTERLLARQGARPEHVRRRCRLLDRTRRSPSLVTADRSSGLLENHDGNEPG